MIAVKRRLIARPLFWILLLAFLLFTTGALLAQIQSRSGESLGIDEILPDLAFFAAEKLNVTAKSTDDIFAAGRDVTIDGAQADHMIVAGGDVIITSAAFRDLILAGGDVDLISGSATDDVVAAGGDLTIRSDFKIGGSAVLAGRDVTIDTPIGAELRAAAARLRLNADVKGDAYLAGDDVVVGPGVHIGGDLRHRARKIEISPSAVVDGEIIALEPAAPVDIEEIGVKAAAALAVFVLAFLIGAAILMVVIPLALPGLMNNAAAMIRAKPFTALGIGVLVVIATPAVIAFLFMTVLGLPLALMIAVLYAAAAPVAFAAVIYFIGMEGRRVIAKGASGDPGAGARLIWSAVAAGLFLLIVLIPFLGGVVCFIGYLFGMGAVMTQGGKALSRKA